MISAYNNKKIEQEVLASGAKGFVKKPITPDDLKFVWKYTIEHRMSGNNRISIFRQLATNKKFVLHLYNLFVHMFNNCITLWEDPENISADDLNRMENSTNNSDDDDSQQVTTKKPKLKWTSALQHKFVLSIKHIGFHSKYFKLLFTYHYNI